MLTTTLNAYAEGFTFQLVAILHQCFLENIVHIGKRHVFYFENVVDPRNTGQRVANVQALVTGEALGQVSSQTLTNLRLIDNVSDTLILRPLISHDKEHIINLAREIGTEDFARTMPEYCGVISKSPTVKAIKSKIEAEEENFDFSILDKVVEEANNIDIRDIAQQTQQTVVEVETVSGFGPNDVILDIRSVDEQDDKPLKVDGVDVVSLPFYKLSTKFGDLDQSKTWLLWCERGVMSRLQALYLREQGFENVKVYRP